jgi:dipeptidyl aminopeptidase/acylaminoacyl peptidase
MVRLGDPAYHEGRNMNDHPVPFSPDGSKFILVLRQADILSNTNVYSAYLYYCAGIFEHPQSKLLFRMASGSNRPAITGLRWSGDGKSFTFLGESVEKTAQVYRYTLTTKHLTRLTSSPTPIDKYGISDSGGVLAYTADVADRSHHTTAEEQHFGKVIDGQWLDDLLAGRDSIASRDCEFFLQTPGKRAKRIDIGEPIHPFGAASVSPDGHYALVSGMFTKMQPEWSQYSERSLSKQITTPKPAGVPARFSHLWLLDVATGVLDSVSNSPAINPNNFAWSADGRSLYIKTHLPLDVSDPKEREIRRQSALPAIVSLASHTLTRISEEEWQRVQDASGKFAAQKVKITLEQDVNHPPQLVATEPGTSRRIVLRDLNPQFKQLQFGKVQIIEWSIRGKMMARAGLYLPPDYNPAIRYPLVIQLHGFAEKRFAMDGMNEWDSAYAARPLAAAGVVVLQAFTHVSQEEWDAFENGKDKRFGVPPDRAGRNLNIEMIESAIDELDRRAIIDPKDIGISGFSRTVSVVGYLLTHSHYPIRAAMLTDGIDGGYLQYLTFPEAAFDFNDMNGGESPFGPGLSEWLKESPSFNMQHLNTPLRVVAIADPAVLEMWEWYVAPTLQDKPVDFIEIPGGTHLMERPWDCQIAMQGMVDWFRFWLQGYERPAVSAAPQYERWRRLREMRDAGAMAAAAPAQAATAN